jgi:lipid A 3-O-deacylase
MISHQLTAQQPQRICQRQTFAVLCRLVTCHKTLIAFVLLGSAFAWAQNRPEDGGNEFQIWTGGGYSVPGGTPNTGVWNAGARFGWILTKPHGPSFLKGRFEYVLDATPAFVVVQKYNTAYGAGFSPLGLKWDFATRGRIEPYLELNGGTLFTNHDVPAATSDVNFTDAAALGIHVLGARWAWSVECRYLHISNAGLSNPNPGINTVEVRLGVGKFWKH